MKNPLFIILSVIVFTMSCNPSTITQTNNPVVVIQTEFGDWHGYRFGTLMIRPVVSTSALASSSVFASAIRQ